MASTATSPRTRARIAGTVYLIFFASAVLGALEAHGTTGLGGGPLSASAMASAIQAHQDQFRRP